MSPQGKVAVALSGGVDSAVAAALLSQAGWQVYGFHLRLSDSQPRLLRVLEISKELMIPCSLLDFRPEFSRQVVDYFVYSYFRGLTPNPCVQCNAAIKFGIFWENVKAQGFDHLATGHYVRLQEGADGSLGLFRGQDRSKDQSYFLHRLPRRLFPHLLFPLGGLTKKTVRTLAHELDLPWLASCQESQEICFIPQEGSYLDFIMASAGRQAIPGDLVNRQGHLMGTHRGVERYTVGQRRGLGLPAREPYYVLEIHPEVNRVVIGTREELMASGLLASGVNWLIDPPAGPWEAQAVIRYRHPGVSALITPVGENEVKVIFASPQAAVAPGQAVVFYHGDQVLGGAWIKASLP